MNRWPFRLARLLPPILLEQPWAIFVKGLCIVSGLTTFFGPQPGSIQALLSRPVQVGWSVCLVAGAACGLWGMLRPAFWRVEVTGLIWLGTAAIVYAITIMLRFGLAGVIAGGITLGLGLAAMVRALAVYVTVEIARDVSGSKT